MERKVLFSEVPKDVLDELRWYDFEKKQKVFRITLQAILDRVLFEKENEIISTKKNPENSLNR